MDETYQTYLNRVARLTKPATYESQLQHIQESPKFKPDETGTRQAVLFPGYSIVTPPWEEEPENSAFYQRLQQCQAQLVANLDEHLFVPVPPESFHFTLADLIWDDAYRHAEAENPEFEPQLHSVIAQSFQQYNQKIADRNKPILWQLLGLMVRPRAIAACLIPQDEDSYQRILQLRRAIYQNTNLIALGIEQQYHFTAHVTLGYFGDVSKEVNPARFTDTISGLNLQWLEEEEPSLVVTRAELRKFDDMLRYYRKPEWPATQL